MTKKTRRILFLSLVILFCFTAPTIVLYSQGYRFDFEKKKITQTGAFYFKVWPKNVEIYLQEEFKKKTDFFFGEALLKNLLPKKYKIEIRKQGFHSWKKTLEIKERQVTEAKNIVLFPENPRFELLDKNIENLFFSPDEKKIILQTKIISDKKESWDLELFDLEKNVKSHLIEPSQILPGKTLEGKEVNLLNVEFSEDSKEIYLKVRIKKEEKNFTINLKKSPPVLEERKMPFIPENILSYQKLNNDIFFLDNSGNLFKSDSSFEPKLKINTALFPVSPEKKYQLKLFSDNLIFLKENSTLYQFNFETKSFEKFFEPIKEIKISSDQKKLVYFSDYEIWILYLDDEISPSHKKGDKVFLLRFSEKIGEFFWLNSHYLIMQIGDKMKIAEIDDRDSINIYDLIEFPNPKFFWSKYDKKIYLLTEENFIVSEKILP